MTTRTILITGGAGFIGSHIADRFLREGWTVRVLDNLDPQVHGTTQRIPPYLDPRVEFVHGDVADRSAVDDAMRGVDLVSHHAANVGVGQSMYEIERYTRTNSLGAATVLDVIVNGDHSVTKMIVASSMSIYGEGLYVCREDGKIRPAPRSPADLRIQAWEPRCPRCGAELQPLPTPETTPAEPSSVYAINKRDQEELFRVVGRAYGIPTIAFRYFNVYGARQALSNPYTGVVAIFASRLLNGKAPLVNEDGLQQRDFVSVLDVAEVNWLVANTDSGNGQVFNVGSGQPVNVLEIAAMIGEEIGPDIDFNVTNKFREGDIRHCFADIATIKKALDWSPVHSLKQSMPELASWIRTQQAVDLVEQSRQTLEQRGLAY